MAFQYVDGRMVFVVELKEFPPDLPVHAADSPELAPYAEALNKAIAQGLIKGPGKYAIEILHGHIDHWQVFAVNED